MIEYIDPNMAAAEAIVKDYFTGMYEGDTERLEGIFNQHCWLFGENSDGCHEFPVAGFIDQIGTGPAPQSVGEPFDMQLVSLDLTGSVGVAKVEVQYQERQYTDYLMLQKTDAGWKIVCKGFYTTD